MYTFLFTVLLIQMMFLEMKEQNIPNLYNPELPLNVVSLVDTETVVSIRTDTTSIRFIVYQRVAFNTSSTPTDRTVDSVTVSFVQLLSLFVSCLSSQ